MGDGDIQHELAKMRVTFKRILAQDHEETLDEIYAAWAKGDTKELTKLGPNDPNMSPEDRKAMLDDRNHNWIPQIVAMLKEKHNYFITVGTFHLVGPAAYPICCGRRDTRSTVPERERLASPLVLGMSPSAGSGRRFPVLTEAHFGVESHENVARPETRRHCVFRAGGDVVPAPPSRSRLPGTEFEQQYRDEREHGRCSG
jgi:hypothetical protein